MGAVLIAIAALIAGAVALTGLETTRVTPGPAPAVSQAQGQSFAVYADAVRNWYETHPGPEVTGFAVPLAALSLPPAYRNAYAWANVNVAVGAANNVLVYGTHGTDGVPTVARAELGFSAGVGTTPDGATFLSQVQGTTQPLPGNPGAVIQPGDLIYWFVA